MTTRWCKLSFFELTSDDLIYPMIQLSKEITLGFVNILEMASAAMRPAKEPLTGFFFLAVRAQF